MARIIGAATMVALACVGCAQALPIYVARLPNGNTTVAALGHMDPNGGGELNVFGQAFKDARHKWSKELCMADSDGDGQTNGQELGDPCCSWAETGNLLYVKGTSHPGDKSSTVNPRKFKNLECLHQTPGEDANSQVTGASAAKTTPPAKPKVTPKVTQQVDGFGGSDSGSDTTMDKKPRRGDNSQEATATARAATDKQPSVVAVIALVVATMALA